MTPTYDHRHVVTLEETNLVGNVYFANYLRWQGHCRERFLADRAPGVLAALHQDLALVTVSCHCDFFSELYATDQVDIRMALVATDDNHVSMAFYYYRVGGGGGCAERSSVPLLVAKGSQVVACMRRDRGGMRPVPIPEELRAALAAYGQDGSGSHPR